MKNLHLRLNCAALGHGGCAEGVFVPFTSLKKPRKLRKVLEKAGWSAILGDGEGQTMLIPVCAACATAFQAQRAGNIASA